MFPHKIFKFGISKNAIFYNFLRSFQQMNTKENAVVGCLVYPSLVLSLPSIQCEERDKWGEGRVTLWGGREEEIVFVFHNVSCRPE